MEMYSQILIYVIFIEGNLKTLEVVLIQILMKVSILCTISLAISYVSYLFVLIFVHCRSISTAMTRTGS